MFPDRDEQKLHACTKCGVPTEYIWTKTFFDRPLATPSSGTFGTPTLVGRIAQPHPTMVHKENLDYSSEGHRMPQWISDPLMNSRNPWEQGMRREV